MGSGSISSYKELIVWQKAMDVTIAIFALCEQFPKTELYGLTSQMKRAAISIPSNIAEGRRRGTRADYRHFLQIAFGSGAELETQIEIAKRLPFSQKIIFSSADDLLEQVMKMLNAMLQKLSV